MITVPEFLLPPPFPLPRTVTAAPPGTFDARTHRAAVGPAGDARLMKARGPVVIKSPASPLYRLGKALEA